MGRPKGSKNTKIPEYADCEVCGKTFKKQGMGTHQRERHFTIWIKKIKYVASPDPHKEENINKLSPVSYDANGTDIGLKKNNIAGIDSNDTPGTIGPGKAEPMWQANMPAQKFIALEDITPGYCSCHICSRRLSLSKKHWKSPPNYYALDVICYDCLSLFDSKDLHIHKTHPKDEDVWWNYHDRQHNPWNKGSLRFYHHAFQTEERIQISVYLQQLGHTLMPRPARQKSCESVQSQ